MGFVVRWIITAIAVGIAVWIVPGIDVAGEAWVAVAVTGGVLALLNIAIKPVLKALSCGLMILTLGLFALVINAGLLYFSAWVSNTVFALHFFIDGFWPAFLGGLVVSVVTVILEALVGEKGKR